MLVMKYEYECNQKYGICFNTEECDFKVIFVVGIW